MNERLTRKKKPPKGALPSSSVVVFLDRDGVINVERGDYVKSWQEFEFLPSALDALKLFAERGIRVVVVTNQSGVSRGVMTLKDLQEIHEKMLAEIRRHGGRVESIYYCPHTSAENCDCRKPKPGMIFRAAKELGIDLASSYLVGDSEREVELARTLRLKCVRISEKTSSSASSPARRWSRRRPIELESLHQAAHRILQDLGESSPA